MNKIKVAIIGTGNISEVHIKAYLKNPNVELYAFCDIDANSSNSVVCSIFIVLSNLDSFNSSF